jgi:thiamine-phosphate pyrophosphorylase
LVGRSCHNADELSQARRDGCDYVTLSPVFQTPSKPGYGPALGLTGLAGLVPRTGLAAAVGLPREAMAVYALGGIQPVDVAGCLAAGAYGIAVMGPVMRDPAIVSQYLAQLSEVAP